MASPQMISIPKSSAIWSLVEKSRAHAANVFAQPPDDVWMHGHKVHDEAMTPTAAAVGEAEQFRVGPPAEGT